MTKTAALLELELKAKARSKFVLGCTDTEAVKLCFENMLLARASLTTKKIGHLVDGDSWVKSQTRILKNLRNHVH